MMTPEEHEHASVSPIPSPLREFWREIRGEISWLHIDWHDCKRLFGTDQKTVDLMNSTAPNYLASVQRMMWGMIILHICRLTDRPQYSD